MVPTSKGLFTMIAGFKLKDGAKVEKVLRDAVQATS